MDGPKRTKGAAADGFPDDPLVEILSRLPAKPLFRFKCVSKGWCHLIADRLGRRKSPQTLEGFFVGGGGGANDWRFINLSGKSVPFVDASFSFLTKLPGIEHIKLLSAHNGLLLFVRYLDCGRYEYIVCNPATEQWMCVPGPGTAPCPTRHLCHFGNLIKSFLIFDLAVSSHFHLFQLWHTGCRILESVHVFSSETGVWRNSTREWKEMGGRIAFGRVASDLGCGDVHGMLHIPVYVQLVLQTKDIQIAVVDTQGKKCRVIHRPDMNEFTAAVFVGQSQGHVHCITVHKKQEGHRDTSLDYQFGSLRTMVPGSGP